MPIYGEKLAESEEAFAAQVLQEKKGTSMLYGRKITDNQPAEGEGALPVLAPTPIGTDYTLAELTAAIEADPKLADELVVTELTRPQGARKGALQYFAKLELEPELAKLVNEALGVFAPAE